MPTSFGARTSHRSRSGKQAPAVAGAASIVRPTSFAEDNLTTPSAVTSAMVQRNIGFLRPSRSCRNQTVW